MTNAAISSVASVRPFRRLLVVITLFGSLAGLGLLGCNRTQPTESKPPVSEAEPVKQEPQPPKEEPPKEEPPIVNDCRWATGTIEIDGVADEEAWHAAEVIDDFSLPWLGDAARPARTATKARLLWDKEHLYFFAEMEDADLYADITEHDGETWFNDVFEMFLKPADDKPGYYEFEISPANTILDMFLPRRGSGEYRRWKNTHEFHLETAVKLKGTLNHWQDTDEGWTLEGRIPWSDFAPTGGSPAVDDRWKFALCRYDYSVAFEGPELSSAARLKRGSFHLYEDYSTLRFLGPELTARRARATNPYAIDRRVPWTTSQVVGSPDPPLPYRVSQTFTKLQIRQPLFVYPEPGTDKLLVIQHLGWWDGPGKILRIADDPETKKTETLLEMDRIAYGVAFHPDYEENGYLFIGSNGPVGSKNKTTRVSRFTVDREAPYRCDPESELVILEWASDGHNGGDLGFHPEDGMLYVTAGDGTTDSDLNRTGQDLGSLCGSMLRLDVDHPDDDKPYSIPKDNPFLDTPGARPEIWAYGLRNPWRMTFDQKTGDLWVGNNGQDLWEQVYLVRRGENYGWSIFEGSHPFYLERKRGPTPIVMPTVEHPHSEARSLTGGVVYYGSKLPELDGAYIYGDWSTGKIWGVRHDGSSVTWHRELADTTLQIGGFGTDHAGELFVVDQGGGIYRLESTPEDFVNAKFPTTLSETGLFTSVSDHQTDPALIPYSVNAPLWSDGAAAERWIALPGTSQIDSPGSRGWNLPEGAVVVKTLSIELEKGNPDSRRRIETQLLTKQQKEWVGYSYRWNDDETDATLVPAEGADRVLSIADPEAPGGHRGQSWRYASRAECMTCHSRAANYLLGLTDYQINKLHDYGDVTDNQLRTLEHLGVFSVKWLEHEDQIYGQVTGLVNRLIGRAVDPWTMPGAYMPAETKSLAKNMLGSTDPYVPSHWKWARRGWDQARARWRNQYIGAQRLTTRLPKPPAAYAKVVDPYDDRNVLAARARSYLHANCSSCHVDAGGGNAMIDLQYAAEPEKTRLFGVKPQHNTFGLADAKLVAPGDPYRSVLLYRMATLGGGRMPRVGSHAVDQEALAMMRQWIREMPAVVDPESGEEAPTEDPMAEIRAEEIAKVEMLQSADAARAAVRTKAIDRLLASTSGAMVLLEAIDEGRLAPAVEDEVVAKTMAHPEGQIRDLFERFVPLEKRIQRLGSAIDPAALLAMKGDAQRGEHLFFNVASIQCKSCHRIGNGPDKLGPDLTEIGKKYTRDQLLETILEPSKKIDEKFVAYTVLKVDGQVVTGLMAEQTKRQIVLKDAENKEIRISAADVDEIRPSPKSIMPELMFRDLTAQQAADLLEYLASLTEPPQIN